MGDGNPFYARSETLVSVVLPTHLSAPPFIAEAVASVIDQTWGFWELIIVDDGSPDPHALAAQVSIDRRVRVVRSTHGGVARARNLGVSHAVGSLVAFLDHDDVWYPEHLSKAVGTLAKSPAAVASFSSMEVQRGGGRGSDHFIGAASVDRHSVLTGRRPSLNTMVIRREALEEVGGFDPRYDSADDLDLIYKLVEKGLFSYVDAVTVFYRVHDDNWSRDVRSMAISGDEVRRDHLQRARWSGDADAVRDLRAAKRGARHYYAGVALGDAVGAARAGQARPAAAMTWWALCYSPAGVTQAVGRLVARRWKKERGPGAVGGASGGGDTGASVIERALTTADSPPLVSIVLPTHLSPPPFLKEAVDSVVGQTWTLWELVVVDDGSSDHDAVAKELGDLDPRVRIVRTVRGGPSRARNLGATHATGELITFLDHDDAWYPEHLSKAVEALAADGGAVAAFSAMEIVDADREHHRAVKERAVDRHSVLSGGERPSLNALVIRRARFDEVGGFDARYDFGEDVDLIIKLVEHGHFAYVDEVAAIYRIHADNWSRDPRRTAMSADRMMRDNIRRVRRLGDTAAGRDLRKAKRHARRFYAGAAIGQAVARWRTKQYGAAGLLAWWAMRFSPFGVSRTTASVIERRWRRQASA